MKIKTYLKILNQIEKWMPSIMQGFDELDEETQALIRELDGEISNRLAEINARLEQL